MRHQATCHPERLVIARGLCESCYRRWWKIANPEAYQRKCDATKRWRQNNLEFARARERQRNRKRPAHYTHSAQLKTAYGITLEDYNQILDAQGGGCAICGKKRQHKWHLPVDHDHVTGVVRGILCPSCNVRLIALDDREWYTKATTYLERVKVGSSWGSQETVKE